ncbi:hypothetical protein LCGC14_2020950 [marine sediment metagenome]|uniref:Uncharacterized protein n=1 Tax=marine sediment metagenome TaxID=412755 RepID=A0A0F9HAX1_9ZZZZ
MTRVTYKHKVCWKSITIDFPPYQEYILTEEALALDRTIKKHKCLGAKKT